MVKKVFLVVSIILFLSTFFLLTTPVQALSSDKIIILADEPADTADPPDVKETVEGADDFLSEGKDGSNDTINFDMLNDTSSVIYNILLVVGICAAVIIAAVLGIQFITGSVEQKVKVKEALIPFVIGCAVLFGAFGIWRLIIILLR